ncbi:MAG: hypothetical protein BWK75_00690 [Candidatus Altiarchaeales archaeon A3]|nr:MAG: hypothetical protein BWK75_00690 [Candidatus Altiarchaeales archaeon A3]
MNIQTILVFSVLVGIVLISGCVEEKPGGNVSEKITIAVSIPPQAEFVKKIVGDKVNVIVMVPPGASPHTYELTPNQMIDLSNAKMYAKVGSGIEFELGWMDKIAEINKNMLIVDCSKGIELREMTEEEENAEAEGHEEDKGQEQKEHHHEVNDPHIWLSPKNAKIIVENIYAGLIKIDFNNKEYYKKNKDSYVAELDKTDKEILEKLMSLKDRKILVFHPSWGYFCRDYNLTQVAIEKSGKEPTLQGVENLIKQAKENNITLIFASPQFSTKSAEVIAKEINGKVVLIDPLSENYTANLYEVADMFSKI